MKFFGLRASRVVRCINCWYFPSYVRWCVKKCSYFHISLVGIEPIMLVQSGGSGLVVGCSVCLASIYAGLYMPLWKLKAQRSGMSVIIVVCIPRNSCCLSKLSGDVGISWCAVSAPGMGFFCGIALHGHELTSYMGPCLIATKSVISFLNYIHSSINSIINIKRLHNNCGVLLAIFQE